MAIDPVVLKTEGSEERRRQIIEKFRENAFHIEKTQEKRIADQKALNERDIELKRRFHESQQVTKEGAERFHEVREGHQAVGEILTKRGRKIIERNLEERDDKIVDERQRVRNLNRAFELAILSTKEQVQAKTEEQFYSNRSAHFKTEEQFHSNRAAQFETAEHVHELREAHLNEGERIKERNHLEELRRTEERNNKIVDERERIKDFNNNHVLAILATQKEAQLKRAEQFQIDRAAHFKTAEHVHELREAHLNEGERIHEQSRLEELRRIDDREAKIVEHRKASDPQKIRVNRSV